MTVYVHNTQVAAPRSREAGWLGKLLRSIFAQRWAAPSPHRLSDHLLRDVGLQRTAGRITHRAR
jgi:hypothetical protein